MRKSMICLSAVSLLVPFLLFGCSGDNGSAGPPGPSSGNIAGTVTDAVKGDPLSGVTVTAKKYVNGVGTDNLVTTTTDGTGAYTLANVPLGTVVVYFAKAFYTSPGGMVVGVLGGQTITMNAAMSEAASGKPSVTITGYNVANGQYTADNFGYGATAALAASGSDPNGDNLVYTWSNATAPVLGSVTGAGTAATVTFPTMDAAFATRADTANLASISGYNLRYINAEDNSGLFGILPVLADTRGTVSTKVEVKDGRGQSASVTLGLNAANVATGARNVSIGARLYLNRGNDNASQTWTLVGPAGSTAALDNVTARFPSFVPDIAGLYTVSAGPNTMEIHAGTWLGVITGGSGTSVEPDAINCTPCHNDVNAVDEFTPWKATGHATIFAVGITGGSGTSGPTCFPCHTVGYDRGAANNGFDDQIAATGWVWPTSRVAGNWDNMLGSFPAVARLANIQCENCHGPQVSGAHPASGPIDNINTFASSRVRFSAEVCGTCHAAGAGHNLYSQWAQSGHSNRELAQGEGTSTTCGRCHGAQGFTVFLDLLDAGNVGGINNPQAPFTVSWSSVNKNNVEPQTCTACHDPHDDANPNQLRLYSDVPLTLAGFGVTGFGKAAICVPCHSEGRSGTLDNTHTFLHEDSATGGLPPQTTSPPHVSAITDIIMGRNVYFMGGNLPMVSKHAAVEDVCVGCHMKLNPKSHLSHGSPATDTHRFSIEPADAAAFCANCHSTTVNGEAIIAAVQAGLDALEAKMNADMLAKLQSYGATLIDVGTDNVAGNRFSAVAFQKNLTTSRPPQTTFKLFYDSNASSATIALDNIKLTSGGTKIFPKSSNMMKAIWNYGMIFIGGGGGKAIHNPSFELLVLSNTRAQNLGN